MMLMIVTKYFSLPHPSHRIVVSTRQDVALSCILGTPPFS
jgi:hypothetical protein